MLTTMRMAILQGKDFKFNKMKYTMIKGVYNSCGTRVTDLKWVLENQSAMVEVEDNYWDSDGRAIKELEDGVMTYYWDEVNFLGKTKWSSHVRDIERLKVGNCFKDKESAEKELTRLKEKQQQRMGDK